MFKIILTFLFLLGTLTSHAEDLGSKWLQLKGKAKDIGIGADGSVWAISTRKEKKGGYGIYRWHWDSGSWKKEPGSGIRLDVDPQGNPWVIKDDGHIYRRKSGVWHKLPGLAQDIGIGADGSVWGVGGAKKEAGHGIFKWDGSKWMPINGSAIRIDVDRFGNPWVINAIGHIYRRSAGQWVKMPGTATDIGIGGEGSVWITGTNKKAGGYGIYKWNSRKWIQIGGSGTQISVDEYGKPWVLNSKELIYRRQ